MGILFGAQRRSADLGGAGCATLLTAAPVNPGLNPSTEQDRRDLGSGPQRVLNPSLLPGLPLGAVVVSGAGGKDLLDLISAQTLLITP